MSDKVLIDLNDLFPAKPTLQSVQEKIKIWDISPYKNKAVQIRGCLPTWTHLLAAGKLYGTVASLDFFMDDGKGGIAIPVYPLEP